MEVLLWLSCMVWWGRQRWRERHHLAGVARVLAIFPHPDDETVACGGTLRRLAALHREVTLLVLTRGERGAGGGPPEVGLGDRRRAEMETAAGHLRVSRLLQWQFPDGALAQQGDQLRPRLELLVQSLRPDLLVTFGPDGLYGHPDHVACSELVSLVRSRALPKPRLWYVAWPRPMRRALVLLGSLPAASGAGGPALDPTTSFFVWPGLGAKVRAWRAHRSQRRAIGAGAGRLFPSWVLPALQPFEYFHEVTTR